MLCCTKSAIVFYFIKSHSDRIWFWFILLWNNAFLNFKIGHYTTFSYHILSISDVIQRNFLNGALSFHFSAREARWLIRHQSRSYVRVRKRRLRWDPVATERFVQIWDRIMCTIKRKHRSRSQQSSEYRTNVFVLN